MAQNTNSKMTSTDPADTGMICIGVVGGPRGVKGEVRVKSYTAAPKDIGAYGPVCNENGTLEYTIRVVGQTKGVVIAKLGGVEDRTAAESLNGLKLYVSRDKLPAAEEDEFYHSDLIGLRAETTQGDFLGTIRAVEDHGAGVFLEIAGGKHGEVLAPFTLEVVPEVSLSKGRVIIDPPFGLLEPAEDNAKGEAELPSKPTVKQYAKERN